MERYVIKREDQEGIFLQGLHMVQREHSLDIGFKWTNKITEALAFETPDEVNSTITFIGDVIDWELEQQCYFKKIEVQKGSGE